MILVSSQVLTRINQIGAKGHLHVFRTVFWSSHPVTFAEDGGNVFVRIVVVRIASCSYGECEVKIITRRLFSCVFSLSLIDNTVV